MDRNDLLAVVHMARQTVEWARAGKGPTLIEALTYRLGAHSTADDPSVYRTDDETQSWIEVEALGRLKRHAKWRGVWAPGMEQEIRQAADRESDSKLVECEKWLPPRVDTMFEDVYESLPAHLEEQKQSYMEYLRRRREPT